MTDAARNPLEIKVPDSLSRQEKRYFRAIIAALPAENGPINQTKLDIAADLATARTRLAKLNLLFEAAAHRGRTGTDVASVERATKIAREANSTTALAMRLAEKLQSTTGERQNGRNE